MTIKQREAGQGERELEQTRERRVARRSALLGCALALVSAIGCGSGDGDPGSAPSGGPLYVGSTMLFSADLSEATGYLFSTGSLNAGTSVDLSRAVEMPETAWVFGDAKPYLYTAAIEQPRITRWEMTATGGFVQGPTVSFANEGVGGTYTAASTPLYSKTKAYFADGASGQVVVWNPTDMTFLRTIPIDVSLDADPANADLAPWLTLAVRNDRILVSVFWGSQTSGWTEFGSQSRLFAIDPNTDAVVEIDEETRCETLSPAGVASDGTAYFTPFDYHNVVRSLFGAGFGAGACLLRVVPQASSFDAGYAVDLSALAGGRPAGSAHLLGDGEMIFHVWHNELVSPTREGWLDGQRFEPGYKWYRWRIGEAAAAEIPEQTPSSEDSSGMSMIDGALHFYSPNAEFSATTLVALGASGRFERRIEVPGWTASVIRVR